MEQVRVNLTLEGEVWGRFTRLVPPRKKSKIINALLKKEIENIEHRNEEATFASAFKKAAKDKNRLLVVREWESLDTEGWD